MGAYHGTSYNALHAIIAGNMLELSQVSGKDAEARFAKQPFFLSVRRNPLLTASNVYPVTIEFSERALHARAQREAVDYWGDVGGRTSIEQEDRYYFRTHQIRRVIGLIKAIHFNLPYYDEKYAAKLRAVLVVAKKAGIATYFYDSDKTYLNLNKRRAVQFDISTLKVVPKNVFGPQSDDEKEDARYRSLRAQRDVKRYGATDYVLDLLYGNAIPKTREADDTVKYVNNIVLHYPHEFKAYIDAEIHNTSNAWTPKRTKSRVSRLNVKMHELGLTTAKLAEHLRDIIAPSSTASAVKLTNKMKLLAQRHAKRAGNVYMPGIEDDNDGANISMWAEAPSLSGYNLG